MTDRAPVHTGNASLGTIFAPQQNVIKIEKARSLKLPQNSRKTSEGCKTRENTFDETRERLF